MNESGMSCREAIRLLAEYLNGELDDGDHTRVERHLEICRDCYSRAQFEQRLNEQLSELGRDQVAPTFERRIRRMIRRFDDESESAERPEPA